ncbi:MAG: hypothetical protein Q9162_001358 [Coniocarpon cinnabarinum]
MAKDNYNIERGLVPALRLNLQQYIWRDALGYDLHPSIDTHDPRLKVADVGTGTGIWLVKLSSQLAATAQLDGFDISSDQFPHESSLPPNVHLHTSNALEPCPPELRGKYDVVNLRLFLAVVKNDDPTALLQHVCSLLKPGGFLQWCEWDSIEQKPIKIGDTESAVAKVCEVLNWFPKGWVARLPQEFQKQGLKVLANHRCREKPWQREMLLDNSCLVVEEFSSRMLRNLSDAEEKRKYEALPAVAQQAKLDARRGAYFSQVFQVVVGQKGTRSKFVQVANELFQAVKGGADLTGKLRRSAERRLG